MFRLLILAHRYLGIGLGLLMVLWCLSGVVMMYVSYPSLSEEQRMAGLEPLKLDRCCVFGAGALADDDEVAGFSVEMLAGKPVLRVAGFGRVRTVDMTDGHVLDTISDDQLFAVAKAFAHDTAAKPTFEQIDHDQWTVGDAGEGETALYRVTLYDPAGTELYVSGVSGRAIQITTAHERFWNWFGAVPHWLYFSELRRRAGLWTQIVIWTSLSGAVLTLIGLYIGIMRFGRRADGRYSPYRGFLYWHHVPGLIFGLFTLSFVASGLLSMNPWGFLASSGAGAERDKVQGAAPNGASVKSTLAAFSHAKLASDIVSLQSAPLDGKLFVIATTADGRRARYDFDAKPALLFPDDAAHIAQALSGNPNAVAQLLTQEDDYYFGHHSAPVSFPVYRVVRNDAMRTRYYFDPVSGALTRKVDANGRGYRWLHEGLHRFDFAAAIRGRPVWDVVMLVLMAGVTTVCVTGAWLGIKRLVRRPVKRAL